jgi:hypothetical protein
MITLCSSGVPHTIGKLYSRDTTLLLTSLQLKFCTQSYETPKFWEFGDFHFGVPRQNNIWVLVPWIGIKYIIKGKVMASPSLGRDEFCEFVFIHDSSMDQKCSNYALTNLFNLCRSVWIIELLVNLLSPHLGAPTHLYAFEVLRAKERTLTFFPFVIFTFGIVVSPYKNLWVCQLTCHLTNLLLTQDGRLNNLKKIKGSQTL